MRRDFITIGQDERLGEALITMRMARLRHLVVERRGVLVGVLTYRTLQDRLIEELERDGADAPAAALAALGVADLMADSPYFVTPEVPIERAALRLCALQLGCLPVAVESPDGPRLVGLVTQSDLLLAAYGTPSRAASTAPPAR